MLSSAENSELVDGVEESNGNTEFDIKVESNLICEPSRPADYKQSRGGNGAVDVVEDGHGTPVTPADISHGSYPLSQLLQGLSDSDGALAQFAFGGEHFSVPVHHLSSADLRNLAKVTCNVLMSAAALPEDSKGEDSNGIVIESGDQKLLMLKHSNSDFISHLSAGASLEGIDSKHVVLSDDKEYLVSDLNPDLFIKSECSGAIQGNIQDPAAIKSENLLSNAEVHIRNLIPCTSNAVVHIRNLVPCTSNAAFCLPAPSNPPKSPIYLAAGRSLTKPMASQFILPALQRPLTLTESFAHKPKRGGRRSRKTSGPFLLGDKHKAPLRILAPRAASAERACVTTAENCGTAVIDRLGTSLRTGPLSDQGDGHYFEALGRCVQCFRFSRTTAYCRAEKRHRDTKASPCHECEQTGRSTVVCRRKLNHKAPNALPINLVINTSLQRPEDIKALCMKNMLPACFSELQSIVVHHADISFATGKSRDDFSDTEYSTMLDLSSLPVAIRKPTDYARGYLYPYSKEAWNAWLSKFCCQTGTNYRIRTGKRVNKKSDHGLANHNGRVVLYRTIETQLYNCALGGKPRKRKLKDGVKRRKERGSKLVGCPAVIHTRLIETENQWCALEITVPKLSSHLVSHDPRSADGDLTVDLPQRDVFQQNVPPAIVQSRTESTTRGSELHLDLSERLTGQQHLVDIKVQSSRPRPSLVSQDKQGQTDLTTNGMLKKQTRSLFLNCANVVGNVNNTELLHGIHDYAQVIYNQLLKASLAVSPPAKRSRSMKSDEPNLVLDETEALHHGRLNLLSDSV